MAPPSPDRRAGRNPPCRPLIAAIFAMALHPARAWSDEPATKPLHGLNFSPNFGAAIQDKKTGEPADELEQWMRIVAPYTRWIRTFDSGNRLADAGAIAHRLDLKAAVSAWLGPERDEAERTANERSIAQLIDQGQQGHVDLAIVGSEVLFRGDLLAEQLLSYLLQVKQALPNIPVTTADTYQHLLDHPEILEAIDTVFMNHYAYWEGIGIQEAIPALNSAYRDLVNASRGKPIIVSESGWPTCGETRGEAVASAENAKYFLLDFKSWAETNQVGYFYFEAFDEPWKAGTEGPQGACWGLWDQYGNPKPDLNMVLNGSDDRIADSSLDSASAQPN
jgi:glucan 1,3-beta-glucosidase